MNGGKRVKLKNDEFLSDKLLCESYWMFLEVPHLPRRSEYSDWSQNECCGDYVTLGQALYTILTTIHITQGKLYSLPSSAVCWKCFQTVWTQIRPDKMSGLIWIQTVWQSDGIPERFFLNINFDKSRQTTKKHAILPSMQRFYKILERYPGYYYWILGKAVWI